MKNFFLLFLGAIFSLPVLTAQTSITIRVNMDAVTDLYPDGDVWVYMDDNWSEWYTMADEDSDGIYTVTIDKDAGTSLYYRFSYQTGPDPDWDYVTENVPGECAADNGFRELLVPAENVELTAFAYGSCDETAVSRVNVTFQVDMSNETVLNNDVQVVIKNPWIWTALADQGNGIWSATVEVDANQTYPYTFVNGGQDNWSGEESLPDECNYGTPSAPERRVTVGEEDVVLNVVNFGECDESITQVNITFRVNLSAVDDLYPDGEVWVYMDDNWSEWYTMTDDDGDDIYTYTLEREAGTTLTYRYSYQNGPDSWNDFDTELVPDDCANDDGFRFLTVPLIDVELPAVAYGSCDEAPNPRVNLTFQVDMSNETVLNNDVQVVIKNPWIWTALTDQGNGIWSGTVEVDANRTYPYTFVNGGQDNWSGEESVPEDCNFGTETAPERHIVVGQEDLVLEPVYFGTCLLVDTDDVGANDNIRIFPNPARDFIQIRSEADPVQAVYIIDPLGRVVASVLPGKVEQTAINLRTLEAGVYVVMVETRRATERRKIVISR